MNTLFKESDVFIKNRPTNLSETQKANLYHELAQEVYDYKWSNGDIDSICQDLQNLNLDKTGYKLAKDLENNGTEAYDFTYDFIIWLNNIEFCFDDELTRIIKQWVTVFDIKPKFKVGDKLLLTDDLTHDFKKGDSIYIKRYDDRKAIYYIAKKKHTISREFPLEKIEAKAVINH